MTIVENVLRNFYLERLDDVKRIDSNIFVQYIEQIFLLSKKRAHMYHLI